MGCGGQGWAVAAGACGPVYSSRLIPIAILTPLPCAETLSGAFLSGRCPPILQIRKVRLRKVKKPPPAISLLPPSSCPSWETKGSWAGSGKGGPRASPSLELTHTHTHTHRRAATGRNPGPEIAMPPSEAQSLLCLGLGRRPVGGRSCSNPGLHKASGCAHTLPPTPAHICTNSHMHTGWEG